MIKFEKNTYDDFFVYVVAPSTSISNTKQIKLFSDKIIENTVDRESIEKSGILTNVIYNLHDNFYCYEITFVKKLKLKTLSFLLVMKRPDFLKLTDIVGLNKKAEKLFHEDGLYGIKDSKLIEHLLYSIEYSEIFGLDRYPTLIDKAATHLWYIIARYQAFHNGNKRTGMLAALTFLRMNFYEIKTENVLENDLYQISMNIALEKMTEKDVVDFLTKHVEFNLTQMATFYNLVVKRG